MQSGQDQYSVGIIRLSSTACIYIPSLIWSGLDVDARIALSMSIY
jgi:hypothetical protein